MPSKTFLRGLIVVELLLLIIGAFVSLATESWLPEPLRAYLEAEAQAEMTVQEVVALTVGIPLLMVIFISSFGLFFLWRPARILYLVTTIVSICFTAFLGPYVDAGLGTALEEAAIFISGIVVALVYFSPLKEFYEKPKPIPNQHTP